MYLCAETACFDEILYSAERPHQNIAYLFNGEKSIAAALNINEVQ